MFRVGQKVVCVDPAHWERWGLKKNEVYTIAELDICILGDPVMSLQELPYRLMQPWDPYDNGSAHPFLGFKQSRFRPVVDTDISIFTAMLNPTPVLEDA